jgi:DNA segregation ATPase FtsK/SpoIIIE-like protein
MSRLELWGTDGAHAGTISHDPRGGKEMGIVQVSLTVCGFENFDFWWHSVYSHVREMFEETRQEATAQEGKEESVTDRYEEAVEIVRRDKRPSTSYLQRTMQIGYNHAANLIDRMEREGIVSPADHLGRRQVLL